MQVTELTTEELEMIKTARSEAQALQLEQDEKIKKQRELFDAELEAEKKKHSIVESILNTMSQDLVDQDPMFTRNSKQTTAKVYSYIDGEREFKEFQYTTYNVAVVLSDGTTQIISMNEHVVYSQNSRRYRSNYSSNKGYKYHYRGKLNSYRDYWAKSPKTVANYIKGKAETYNELYEMKNKKISTLERAEVIVRKTYENNSDVTVTVDMNFSHLKLTTKYGTNTYRYMKFDENDELVMGVASFNASTYGMKYLNTLTTQELEV